MDEGGLGVPETLGPKPDEEKMEIRKLNVSDSINHALFISQTVMELLIEKDILTKPEIEAKYNEMVKECLTALRKETKLPVEKSGTEMFEDFMKGVKIG